MTQTVTLSANSRNCAILPTGRGCAPRAELESLVAPGEAPQGASPTTPQREPVHYSHRLHAARCQEAGARRGETLQAYVQVKLGRGVYCARVKRAWLTEQDQPMWSLDLALPDGTLTAAHVPTFKVRQCSGLDGFCRCAGEGAQDGRAAAGQGPATGAEM